VSSLINLSTAVTTCAPHSFCLFFFNAPPPPHTSPLSLPDALPIYACRYHRHRPPLFRRPGPAGMRQVARIGGLAFLLLEQCQRRSEEHTSELQSRENLVCRLLLEKKKKKKQNNTTQQKHT